MEEPSETMWKPLSWPRSLACQQNRMWELVAGSQGRGKLGPQTCLEDFPASVGKSLGQSCGRCWAGHKVCHCLRRNG